MQKLQYVQNRILMEQRKHDHHNPSIPPLLPISLHIEYKVSLLAHQSIHSNAPHFLKELLMIPPLHKFLPALPSPDKTAPWVTGPSALLLLWNNPPTI